MTPRARRRVRRFSVLLCGIGGPIIGCTILGMVNGRPLLVTGWDIAGVPIVIYALMSMALPGAGAGLLAGSLAIMLVDHGYAARLNSVAAQGLGAALGGAAGALLAAIMFGTGAKSGQVWAVTVVTAMLCGVCIATYTLWLAHQESATAGCAPA